MSRKLSLRRNSKYHYHKKYPTLLAIYTHADLTTSSFSCLFCLNIYKMMESGVYSSGFIRTE